MQDQGIFQACDVALGLSPKPHEPLGTVYFGAKDRIWSRDRWEFPGKRELPVREGDLIRFQPSGADWTKTVLVYKAADGGPGFWTLPVEPLGKGIGRIYLPNGEDLEIPLPKDRRRK
jgi:hypothetical protein